MKVYLRDRITACFGVGVLAVLAATSYYYSIRSEIDANRTLVNREAPDYITTGFSITEFNPNGVAHRRVFAEYAEHYTDGRLSSMHPKLITLSVEEPQVRATADTGQSLDGGETFIFTGNVEVFRAGDLQTPPMRFTTTHLTVYPDTSRIQTDAPVRMVRGSDVTTGIGMTLDNVEKTLYLHHDVRTSIMPKSRVLTH